MTYVWEQRFAAGRVTEVRHTYVPRTEKGLFGESADRRLARSPTGCSPSIETLTRAVKPGTGRDALYQTRVAYISRTANNWKTPIGEFTLVVFKERGETVVLCSDLPAARVSADSVEVSLENYMPSQDLVVYFLAVDDPRATYVTR